MKGGIASAALIIPGATGLALPEKSGEMQSDR